MAPSDSAWHAGLLDRLRRGELQIRDSAGYPMPFVTARIEGPRLVIFVQNRSRS